MPFSWVFGAGPPTENASSSLVPSTRRYLKLDDEARTDRLLSGIVGKRLTYRDSPAG